MSAQLVRSVFPVVTAVAATLYLAIAAPREFVSEAQAATAPVPAAVQHCLAAGRDADACLDEADGMALVESADWVARTQPVARRVSR